MRVSILRSVGAALLLALGAAAPVRAQGLESKLQALLPWLGEEQVARWRLVGLYDGSAVGALEPKGDGYAWLAASGMTGSCGPVKRPAGLGIFEAEAIAGGLLPTLTLVLQRAGESPEEPVRADEVRVVLRSGGRTAALEPAVEPRRLALRVHGDGGTRRFEQLIRTQLAIELCLEHKLGRAWTGQDEANVREAFLLDPPGTSQRQKDSDEALHLEARQDRMYFGGQGKPVPAYLGPPDACLAEGGRATGGGGDGSADLVPSDVWSASLRACGKREVAGAEADGLSPPMPLHSGVGETADRSRGRRWEGVDVALSSGSGDIRVQVRTEKEVLFAGPLFERTVTESIRAQGGGLIDVLSRIPRVHPSVGPPDDPHQLTVLLVPDWQVIDALNRLGLGTEGDDERPVSGVSWLLSHPELLSIQVARDAGDGQGPVAGADWLELGSVLAPGPFSSRRWGYAVGFSAGRVPAVLPGARAATWTQTLTAQRGGAQAMALLGLAVIGLVTLGGLRRVRDLWTQVPEIAVDHWPSAPKAEEVAATGPPSGNEVLGGE